MRSSNLTVHACMLGIILSGLSTSAQSLSITLNGVTPIGGYAAHAGYGNFSPSTFAGQENFTLTSQTGASYPTSIALFAVELQRTIALGSSNVFELLTADQGSKGVGAGYSTNIPLAGIGPARTHALEVLYAHVFPTTYDPAALSITDRNAFQFAVWELSHDDDFDLITKAQLPHFWISSPIDAVVLRAQEWVSWVGAHEATAPTMQLSALHNSTVQDFLIPTDTATFAAIPEPAAAAALIATAMLAVAIVARRKSSRAKSVTV